MAAGDLITADYQYEYNGLLLGANTPYEMTEVTGLSGFTGVRSSTVERFGRHGGNPGKHLLPTRQLIVESEILAGNATDFKARRDALDAAFAVRTEPTDVLPFVFQHPGPTAVKTVIYARPTAKDIRTDLMFAMMNPSAVIRLEASDPFIYGLTVKSVAANPGTTSGGLDFPLVFPLVFGTGSGGSAVATNGGTADTNWTATLTGEMNSPIIRHVEQNKELSLNGLVVASGDTLEFDSKQRTILLNGTASRRSFLTTASKWFTLTPGTNTIQISASGTPTGSMTLYWQDAYWSN